MAEKVKMTMMMMMTMMMTMTMPAELLALSRHVASNGREPLA
jgi:hypothetical protein